MPRHAYLDLDKDGQTDMVSLSGCAFLTSVPVSAIHPALQCQDQNMSIIGFPNEPDKIGQKLVWTDFNQFTDFTKTVLVQTEAGDWCHYHLEKFQINKFCLNDENLFKFSEPNLADYLDTYLYFFNHLGLVIIFKTISFFSGGAV